MVKMIEMMIPIIGNASGQVVSVGLWISAGWVPFCRSLEPSRFCRPLMNYNALFGSFFKIRFPAGSSLSLVAFLASSYPLTRWMKNFSKFIHLVFACGVGIRPILVISVKFTMFTLIKTAA
ncbi:MAG: hypothetical protein IT490_09530 [Candidatus Contendobacter sp.]|nr:hypothetical protein [Candidatus Contendobacter sp.]